MLVLTLAVLACAQQRAPEPVARPAPDTAAAELAVPPAPRTDVVSGYVLEHGPQVLRLDSGGPVPFDLFVRDAQRVTVDGRDVEGSEIRRGDVVRAIYRTGDEGEAVAQQVWADSGSVTRYMNLPAQPAAAPRPEARTPPPLRRTRR